MTQYHNINPSSFRHGEYVGYANGVWRIKRTNGDKTWTAYKDSAAFTRRTLREISEALDATVNA